MSLTILITNIVLANRSGTEVVVEQLADGLRRRGHRPVIFAQMLGPLAEQMRSRGHIVTDRPDILPFTPDVIHGHHTAPVMAALAANPGVPALFLCHGAASAFDSLPPHPGVARIFAVDELCRARLIADGAAAGRVELLPNAIDLSRILPHPHLPKRPRRAVVLTKHAVHLPVIRAACAAAGIALEEYGSGAGHMIASPEAVFAQADLVFATARTAMEAAAAGAGVIVCDGRGMAGFLDLENAAAWLPWNLGAGILTLPMTEENVSTAIACWSAEQAEQVSLRVCAQYGIEWLLDRLEVIYRDLINAPPTRDAQAEAAATGAFIAAWTPHFDQTAPWRWQADQIASPPIGSPLDGVVTSVASLTQSLSELRSAHTAQEARMAAMLTASLAGMASTFTNEQAASEQRMIAHHRATRVSVRLAASLSALWRRLVPLALRAPLHKMRRRLLGHPIA